MYTRCLSVALARWLPRAATGLALIPGVLVGLVVVLLLLASAVVGASVALWLGIGLAETFRGTNV